MGNLRLTFAEDTASTDTPSCSSHITRHTTLVRDPHASRRSLPGSLLPKRYFSFYRQSTVISFLQRGNHQYQSIASFCSSWRSTLP